MRPAKSLKQGVMFSLLAGSATAILGYAFCMSFMKPSISGQFIELGQGSHDNHGRSATYSRTPFHCYLVFDPQGKKVHKHKRSEAVKDVAVLPL